MRLEAGVCARVRLPLVFHTHCCTRGHSRPQELFFHRVILDEIQFVELPGGGARRVSSSGDVDARARAALELQGANRWAVSGTPLESPEDVQAVLRFLRHQPMEAQHWWQEVGGRRWWGRTCG